MTGQNKKSYEGFKIELHEFLIKFKQENLTDYGRCLNFKNFLV